MSLYQRNVEFNAYTMRPSTWDSALTISGVWYLPSLDHPGSKMARAKTLSAVVVSPLLSLKCWYFRKLGQSVTIFEALIDGTLHPREPGLLALHYASYDCSHCLIAQDICLHFIRGKSWRNVQTAALKRSWTNVGENLHGMGEYALACFFIQSSQSTKSVEQLSNCAVSSLAANTDCLHSSFQWL